MTAARCSDRDNFDTDFPVIEDVDNIRFCKGEVWCYDYMGSCGVMIGVVK